MSVDTKLVVGMARQAAQAAEDGFRALYVAVGSRPDAPSFEEIGTDIDKLSMTLHSLSGSATALSSGLAHDVFEARMPTDVQFSHAIVVDMNTIAELLWSMLPLNLPEPEDSVDEQKCQNISEMIKCYDKAVSAVLRHHSLCVQMNHIIIVY
jgi:hypothetical protein